MDMPNERVPESLSSAFDPGLPAALPLDEPDAYDLHREINARRAQLENPELLRRLRSL